MRDVRVALAQIHPKLGQVDSNVQLHVEMAQRAHDEGAGVAVFPELGLTGYVLRDQVPDVALRVDDPALDRLKEISRKIDLVLGFVEESTGHRFYNAAAYLSGGQVIHLHRKVYLPTYGLFQEGRDFSPGELIRAFDGPLGPAGLLVCEDLWHPTCSWLLAHGGAEVLFVLSNGPTRGTNPDRGFTSVAVWEELLHVTAQFQTSYMVYVNRVGCEDGLTFGGGSVVVDPFGRTVGRLPALDEGLLVVQLEDEVLRRARTAYPLLRDENLELVHRELGRIRRIRYDLPDEKAGGERIDP